MASHPPDGGPASSPEAGLAMRPPEAYDNAYVAPAHAAFGLSPDGTIVQAHVWLNEQPQGGSGEANSLAFMLGHAVTPPGSGAAAHANDTVARNLKRVMTARGVDYRARYEATCRHVATLLSQAPAAFMERIWSTGEWQFVEDFNDNPRGSLDSLDVLHKLRPRLIVVLLGDEPVLFGELTADGPGRALAEIKAAQRMWVVTNGGDFDVKVAQLSQTCQGSGKFIAAVCSSLPDDDKRKSFVIECEPIPGHAAALHVPYNMTALAAQGSFALATAHVHRAAAVGLIIGGSKNVIHEAEKILADGHAIVVLGYTGGAAEQIAVARANGYSGMDELAPHAQRIFIVEDGAPHRVRQAILNAAIAVQPTGVEVDDPSLLRRRLETAVLADDVELLGAVLRSVSYTATLGREHLSREQIQSLLIEVLYIALQANLPAVAGTLTKLCDLDAAALQWSFQGCDGANGGVRRLAEDIVTAAVQDASAQHLKKHVRFSEQPRHSQWSTVPTMQARCTFVTLVTLVGRHSPMLAAALGQFGRSRPATPGGVAQAMMTLCLLANRPALAECLWNAAAAKCDPLLLALQGIQLCRSLAQSKDLGRMQSIRESMLSSAERFEELASQVLDKMYAINREATLALLSGDPFSIHVKLALEINADKIVSHEAVMACSGRLLPALCDEHRHWLSRVTWIAVAPAVDVLTVLRNWFRSPARPTDALLPGPGGMPTQTRIRPSQFLTTKLWVEIVTCLLSVILLTMTALHQPGAAPGIAVLVLALIASDFIIHQTYTLLAQLFWVGAGSVVGQAVKTIWPVLFLSGFALQITQPHTTKNDLDVKALHAWAALFGVMQLFSLYSLVPGAGHFVITCELSLRRTLPVWLVVFATVLFAFGVFQAAAVDPLRTYTLQDAIWATFMIPLVGSTGGLNLDYYAYQSGLPDWRPGQTLLAQPDTIVWMAVAVAPYFYIVAALLIALLYAACTETYGVVSSQARVLQHRRRILHQMRLDDTWPPPLCTLAGLLYLVRMYVKMCCNCGPDTAPNAGINRFSGPPAVFIRQALGQMECGPVVPARGAGLGPHPGGIHTAGAAGAAVPASAGAALIPASAGAGAVPAAAIPAGAAAVPAAAIPAAAVPAAAAAAAVPAGAVAIPATGIPAANVPAAAVPAAAAAFPAAAVPAALAPAVPSWSEALKAARDASVARDQARAESSLLRRVQLAASGASGSLRRLGRPRGSANIHSDNIALVTIGNPV